MHKKIHNKEIIKTCLFVSIIAPTISIFATSCINWDELSRAPHFYFPNKNDETKTLLFDDQSEEQPSITIRAELTNAIFNQFKFNEIPLEYDSIVMYTGTNYISNLNMQYVETTIKFRDDVKEKSWDSFEFSYGGQINSQTYNIPNFRVNVASHYSSGTIKPNFFSFDETSVSKNIVTSFNESFLDEKNNFNTFVVWGGFDEIADNAFDTSPSSDIEHKIPSTVKNFIPSSVSPLRCTKIGKNAFSYADFSRIVIPDSVAIIGEKSFFCNKHVENIKISIVQEIEDCAFGGIETLYDYSFPNDLSRIDYDPTAHSLHNIDPNSDIFGWYIQNDISDNQIGKVLFKLKTENYDMKVVGSLAIGSITIGPYASQYHGTYPVYSQTGNDYLKKVDAYAFEECASLYSVTLQNLITSIESSAFKNCSSLSSIKIGFYDTENFADSVVISLPSDMLNNNPFENCNKLNTIYVPVKSGDQTLIQKYRDNASWNSLGISFIGYNVD
ncbi:MAG: leucine-rich repeat domain-containing protein [Mycoplasmataceae bacterium]|nr:leucine-rich repeat domain-containing protein [Mycoplasmataceae bacterium]